MGNGTTGTDNGNVIQVANGKPGQSNRTQNFGYDSLGRIQTAYTSGPSWGENYSIDAWGNLYARSGVAGKNTYEPFSCLVTVQNQLSTCQLTYDAAGNLIQNGTVNYTYDAENRLIATGSFSYIYDGDGRRIEKCTEGMNGQGNPAPGTCAANAVGTFYWRQVEGATLAESDLGGNWTAAYGIIRGRIASRADLTGGTNVPHYYFQDQLGTTNILTDASGNILKESDYFPYGGEIPISGSDPNHYKFTGKERDSDSGLDNFDFRYYSSSMGRFMKPDDPFNWNESNPQSLNLYGYVSNNPLNRVDPDGHDCIYVDPDSGKMNGFRRGDCDNSTEALANSGVYVNGTVDVINENSQDQVIGYGATGDAGTTVVGVITPPGSGLLQQASDSWQNFKTDWQLRIDANRPPPQKPSNLDPLQYINNIMMGMVPLGGIRFGNNPNQEYHTFRHLEEAGIDKQAAADAITKDLSGKAESLPQGLTKGQVSVGGRTLDYNAYKLPDGTINVGRITVR